MRQVLKFALLMSGLCSFPHVHADMSPSPAIIAPLAEKSLLLDVVKTPNNHFIAVGERGHILVSPDGTEWTQSASPLDSTLTAVDFVDDNLGWAVGHDSSIIHTQDGGQSWHIQQFLPASEKPLLDVMFFDAKHGVAIGAYGMFYRTLDGGNSWQSEHHIELLPQDDIDYLNEIKLEDPEAYEDELSSILAHFNRLQKIGDSVVMVGEVGLLAKSDDQGRHWQLLDEVYPGSFYDIAALDSGRIVVSGLRGHVFTSDDMGENWNELDTGITNSINSIITVGDDLILLANGGDYLISRDGGETFTPAQEQDGKALLNGVVHNNKMLLVTEVGIKTITLN